MIVATHLKEKSKHLKTKYHQLRDQVEWSYGAIQNTVASRFHKNNAKPFQERDSFYKLIEKAASPYISRPKVKIKVSINNKSLFIRAYYSYLKVIDWTQGRFKGRIVKLIIRNGNIVEKVYISPKGSLIVVKRYDRILLSEILSMK